MSNKKRTVEPVGPKLLVVCAIGVLVGLGLCGLGRIAPASGSVPLASNILGAFVFAVSVLGFVLTGLSLIAVHIVRRLRG